MSDNTRNFYGRAAGLVEERYMASVFGTFRAAVEEHLPVTVINDWNLNADGLGAYKVLVLPNTACLDDAASGGGRAVRPGRRRAGGEPRRVAVRRVRQSARQLRPGRGARRRLSRPAGQRRAAAKRGQLDVNFAKAIGPDYWEKRKNVFDFKQDTGVAA